MEFIQSSNVYTSSDTPITSFTVQNANRYKKLLVIVHSNYQSAYPPEEFIEWLYFNYGSEIIRNGVFNNTPTYGCRMYLVNVTSQNMSFTDMRCYGYQVWGMTEDVVEVLKQYSVTDQPGKTIPSQTSIDLSDTSYNDYSSLLVLIGEVLYSGRAEPTMRSTLYITGKNDNGYSGNFSNSDSSSSLLLGFIIPSSQINDVISNLSTQVYAVIGVRVRDKGTPNIKAIGDWFRSTRYLKEEIDNFFVQNNDYTAYKLTIKGETGTTVTLTGQTSGLVYKIKMTSTSVTKLLFFTAGETVTATDGTNTVNKVLSARVDEIVLVIKYQFNEDYQTNQTYTITSNKSDIPTFARDFILKYCDVWEFNHASVYRTVIPVVRANIDAYVNFILSQNTKDADGLTFFVNTYYGRPVFYFSYVNLPSGQTKIWEVVTTNGGFKYANLANIPTDFTFNGDGGQIKMTSNVASGIQYLTEQGYNSREWRNSIGYNFDSFQSSGNSLGIHY